MDEGYTRDSTFTLRHEIIRNGLLVLHPGIGTRNVLSHICQEELCDVAGHRAWKVNSRCRRIERQ